MATDPRGTSGGVEVDDVRLQELADEAERGYDPKRLRARSRRGRPPLGSEAARVFQVRLEPELRESLERRADAEGTTPSDIARSALRDFLTSTSPRDSLAREETSRAATTGQSEHRDVTPNPDGGWDVRNPSGERASSHHATQKDAIQAARRVLKNQGGGELRVKGRDGCVRESAVAPKKAKPHQESASRQPMP